MASATKSAVPFHFQLSVQGCDFTHDRELATKVFESGVVSLALAAALSQLPPELGRSRARPATSPVAVLVFGSLDLIDIAACCSWADCAASDASDRRTAAPTTAAAGFDRSMPPR